MIRLVVGRPFAEMQSDTLHDVRGGRRKRGMFQRCGRIMPNTAVENFAVSSSYQRSVRSVFVLASP